MKTAVSVPDPVYWEAEQFARRTRRSRSQLYTEAVAEYLARHAPDAVTEAMDQVCERLEGHDDRFVTQTAQETLRNAEW
ncbi:MAG: hypothetical protein AB2L07_01290 [Thermoanaerobaculaceae bacterium]